MLQPIHELDAYSAVTQRVIPTREWSPSLAQVTTGAGFLNSLGTKHLYGLIGNQLGIWKSKVYYVSSNCSNSYLCFFFHLEFNVGQKICLGHLFFFFPHVYHLEGENAGVENQNST